MRTPYYITKTVLLLLFIGLSACSGSGGGESALPSDLISSGSTGDTGDSGSGGSNNSFNIDSRSPDVDAINRALVTQVNIHFNKAMIPATVSNAAIAVVQGNQAITKSIAYTEGETELTITFPQLLSPDETYTVTINSNLMAADGESLTTQEWSFSTAGNIGTTSQVTIDQCMSDFDIDMLAAVNNARVQPRDCGNGNLPSVPALAWHCRIEIAALNHSQDMASNDFFSHTGSTGSTSGQRVSDAGYQSNSVAENIAAGYGSIASVMDGWLNSTGHCENIMRNSVTEFGAARVDESGATYPNYWTQNFARPRT
jgi:uncharacterized protein YkwD